MLMQTVLTEAIECYQKQFVATDIMNHNHEHVDAIAIWAPKTCTVTATAQQEASP